MRQLILIVCSILLASAASAETTMLQITRRDSGKSFAK